jgi:hypothetical protein
MRCAIMVCLLAAPLPGFACELPDEGNMPLRRAVTRVEMLPEVHAWARDNVEKGRHAALRGAARRAGLEERHLLLAGGGARRGQGVAPVPRLARRQEREGA